MMRSWIQLENRKEFELPARWKSGDIRFTSELVRHFLTEFTQPSDTVLDPFAGFGTTLFVAEQMERIPFGIEYNPDRAAFIRDRLTFKDHLIHGDARQLATYSLPKIDFSITSPPYMQRGDKENPFTDYQIIEGDYQQYLHTITQVYQQLKPNLSTGATVVIEAANLKNANGVTTLAWDIGRAISTILTFQGEVIINWDKYGYGYEHSYCLIFKDA